MRKALTRTFGATALLLAACDTPLDETCSDAFEPPCSARAYSLSLSTGEFPQQPHSDSNLVDAPGFSVSLQPSRDALTKSAKTVKAALSCGGCEFYFRPDSVYFTTDILTQTGDTLPAGHNFVNQDVPAGFKFFNTNWIGVDSIQGFRDSVFEVRFVGKVDQVVKSATLTLHITNSALLIP